jgi:hypothetical protein
MKSIVHVVTAVAAVGFASVFASPASASCLVPSAAALSPAGATPWFRPAAYSVRPVDNENDNDNGGPSIVGFWHVSFFAKGNAPGGPPDETPIDDAYVQWHSDGTEIMNSSRPPIIGSFCLGVWKATGPRTYKLTHLAKSWGVDGFTFIGPAVVVENVTLGRNGNSYSGTFSITQYDTEGHVVPPAPNLPAAPILGVIRASRITAD